MILDNFLNIPVLGSLSSEIRIWGVIIAAFALGLASINLARFHVVRVARQTTDWPYSVACLIAMAAFGLGGIAAGPGNDYYRFYFANFFSPMAVATMGMTIFFIATAAFRAVTIRSLEAGVLLAAALVVMLGNIPLGDAISPHIPDAAEWIRRIPNMAGQRGILITSAIGSIAFGLRVLIGLERTQFGAGAG